MMKVTLAELNAMEPNFFLIYFNSQLHKILENVENLGDRSLGVMGELEESLWSISFCYFHKFPFNFLIDSLINYKPLE